MKLIDYVLLGALAIFFPVWGPLAGIGWLATTIDKALRGRK